MRLKYTYTSTFGNDFNYSRKLVILTMHICQAYFRNFVGARKNCPGQEYMPRTGWLYLRQELSFNYGDEGIARTLQCETFA